MKHKGLITATFLFVSLSVIAAETGPAFPELTGRVVDNAGMLDTSHERRINALLADHENATNNQVVVVTLPDLGGDSIETYGYQLGRAWGVGQKGKDNGVLLIVAKQERRVRIEVGYGLEGKLTDAIASNIIHAVILPVFKRGNFDEGIELGVNAIIEALGGQYLMRPERSAPADRNYALLPVLFLLFVSGLLFVSQLIPQYHHRGYYGGWRGRYRGRSSSGWGGFSSGGGGFSGGGGGFGGGGASGGW